jgi:hypothetical protein
VGALEWNFDASGLPNGTLSSPLLYNSWLGGNINFVNTLTSNVAVLNGQVVLTLSETGSGTQSGTQGSGAAVTSADAADPFSFSGGYTETEIVVPNGGWWAMWLTSLTPQWPAAGEIDYAENGFFSGAGSSDGVGITSGFVYEGNTSGALTPDVKWVPQPTPGETIVIGNLWKPGISSTTYVNGVQIVQQAGSYVTSGPMYVVANIGYNGTSGSDGDQLKFSYIRVWALP